MSNQDLPLDDEGFLIELSRWNEDTACQLARCEQIELTPEHWAIIHLTRQYYQQYKLSPAMRPLVKYLRQHLGPEQGNSLYLLRLFPDSPARRISKIAGLPKPDNCL